MSLLCGLMLIISACSPGSESPPPGTGFLNLDDQPRSHITMTVHFQLSATKVEMAQVVEDMDAALMEGGLADLPTESGAFYEDHRLVMSWASADAGERGEGRVRTFLDGVSIVERIEVAKR